MLLKQVISLFLLSLCLLFVGKYYAGFIQQQRESHYYQLAHIFLWQGVQISSQTGASRVYNRWQAEITNKLPGASAYIKPNTVTINYKSSLQDEPITLNTTF